MMFTLWGFPSGVHCRHLATPSRRCSVYIIGGENEPFFVLDAGRQVVSSYLLGSNVSIVLAFFACTTPNGFDAPVGS